MKYLLDTNICIYLINRKPPQVLRHFQKHTLGDIGVSSITVAELQFGIQKSRYPEQNRNALELFLLPLLVADFDTQAAVIYGNLRAILEKAGTPIGALDTLIAAHALSLDAILVTNNIREFSRVSGLSLEDWAAE
ncbi:MAG: type II toxin-antitoxin system VapC family toxin [Anaerolineae bacterium]|nr:type II toxin-antitoxin system VapC family toxin [Anaerolineae bacterium]